MQIYVRTSLQTLCCSCSCESSVFPVFLWVWSLNIPVYAIVLLLVEGAVDFITPDVLHEQLMHAE